MKCFIEWVDGSGEAVSYNSIVIARKAIKNDGPERLSKTREPIVALIKNFNGDVIDTAVITKFGVCIHSQFEPIYGFGKYINTNMRIVSVKFNNVRMDIEKNGYYDSIHFKEKTKNTKILLYQAGVEIFTPKGEYWTTFK